MNSQFHDDGEKELGPTVATLSLGSPAIMNFRGKKKAGFGGEKKDRPIMLSFRLQHGDTVIMHGTRIHQYYEVGSKASLILQVEKLTLSLSTVLMLRESAGLDLHAATSVLK